MLYNIYLFFIFLFFNYLDFVTLIINNLNFIFYFKDIFSQIILFFLYVLFFWQNLITISMPFWKIIFNHANGLFEVDKNFIVYLKFYDNIWYNFFYSVVKFYITLKKKKNNFFFIFFRWVLFITPIYWLFLLFCFYIYYCYLNIINLIRIININFILFKFFFSFLVSIYKIFNPILNFIYYYIYNKFNLWFIIKKFITTKVYRFVKFILQKILFYLQVYMRRIKKFFKFRYKLKFVIYFLFFKKSLWIYRYNKLKFIFNWVFKLLRIIKNKLKVLIYFNYLNFKFIVLIFIKWITGLIFFFYETPVIKNLYKKILVKVNIYLKIISSESAAILAIIKSLLKTIWRDKLWIFINIVIFIALWRPILLAYFS